MPSHEPFLQWLDIRGYRAFRHVRVDGLARANLIVGKNNVGKSTLLEAIWLLATSGSFSTVSEILISRHENLDRRSENEATDPFEAPLLSLFHGRKELPESGPSLVIDSNSGKLTAGLEWYVEDSETEPSVRLVPVKDPLAVDPTRLIPAFRIAGKASRFARLDRPFRRLGFRPQEAIDTGEPCRFIGPGGVVVGDLAAMWDRVVLTPAEDRVVRSLQFIAPGVERISFVGGETGLGRIPKARTANFEKAVPLKSLGDGANRVLGLLLALATVRNGILLVDEVENGIHYSVQESLWDLLMTAAEEFNVQIFATTHSSDCIRAFQRAARRIPGETGSLTRLEFRGEHIVASRFSEDELEMAEQAHVEVR